MPQYTPEQIERLVELVTREVLIALHEREQPAETCDCDGTSCVCHCADKVRAVVAAGASRISAGPGAVPADDAIARLIDHTLLKPDATEAEIAQLCFEARKFRFAAVCVNPTHARLCAELLKGSDVLVACVVGFPLGASPPDVKAYEAEQAIRDGACEIDMVINIGALKSRDYELVARDVVSVVQTAHHHGAGVKVIIEAALLSDEEKVVACQIARAAGADYVKTSTGFGPGGATVHDVELMRATVGPAIGVKAAGGIRTLADAQAMIAAGATRIGASAGVKIVQEARGERPQAPAARSNNQTRRPY
jgi:deoxyribose-phosphate aldolase